MCVVLKSDRLLLRPPRLSDFDDIYAMWSDGELTQYITKNPYTAEEAWGRLLRNVGHWKLLGFGHWIVCNRTDLSFIGEIGFAQFKRGIDSICDNTPEIGWLVKRSQQFQGYATEAVSTALQWADTSWPNIETVCLISPDNLASQKLAKKFNYLKQISVCYKSQPMIVYRRSVKLTHGELDGK